MAFAAPKLPTKEKLLKELQKTIDSVKEIQSKGATRKLRFEDYISNGRASSRQMNFQSFRESSASKSPATSRPTSRTPPWKRVNTKVMKSTTLGHSPYSSVEREREKTPDRVSKPSRNLSPSVSNPAEPSPRQPLLIQDQDPHSDSLQLRLNPTQTPIPAQHVRPNNHLTATSNKIHKISQTAQHQDIFKPLPI